jgi:light-regulated signal transduction histidine kinase (bacteriophytochrome)
MLDVRNYRIEPLNSNRIAATPDKAVKCHRLHHGNAEPCGQGKHPCPIEQTKLTGKPAMVEHLHYDSENNPRNVEIHSYPVFNDEGEIDYIIQHCIDITERRQAQEKLKSAMENIARTNEHLKEFTQVASHDLKEPLRTVAAYTRLLDEHCGHSLDTKGRKYVQDIISATERMQNLIKDLLEYCRLDIESRNFQEIDTNSLLKSVMNDLSEAIRHSSAQLSFEDLPTVRGDRSQLGRVFQNLISNALKFQGEKPPIIDISAQRKGNFWQFSVTDNGIGIEERHHKRIMKIFKRLHPEEIYPGTGMGLAICSNIIERHGGEIGVCSEPGKGSTFYFTLPV